ncbi:unnamed protein product [Darwinula stevensoni]|uniref:Phosphodiesterase n=1 Tax=Darwinula stevensoni TaxID=69355 RepID=A0A7R8X3D0_9CRUS|nr:unnamed protein product [Darwinula stevensoni]CAG0884837.1 unnamed protein product [Darwinula stevensoni]
MLGVDLRTGRGEGGGNAGGGGVVEHSKSDSHLCVGKDYLRKSHSDPTPDSPSIHRHQKRHSVTSKCILKFDDYSYVIEQGSLKILRRSSSRSRAMERQMHVQEEPATPHPQGHGREDHAKKEDNSVRSPESCNKAAIRLREAMKDLKEGMGSEMKDPGTVMEHLQYAVHVLEELYKQEQRKLLRSDPDEEQERGKDVVKRGNEPWYTHCCRRTLEDEDELSEVEPALVPPEVRAWLASTFTKGSREGTRRRPDEKPRFRSVANAIRAGIFVERISRRPSAAHYLHYPPGVTILFKHLDEWNFDVFALHEASGGAPLKFLGYELLNRYGLLHKFKIPSSVLVNFLTHMESGYLKHGNPYHNNIHATDVTQTVHYALYSAGLMNWMSDLEVFASLLAAISHDYEHTGTTNNFHVNSGSSVALLYNDRAVLENHHASAMFRLLKEEECNVLRSLTKEEYREFRSLAIDMILATDMSSHFQQVKSMKGMLSGPGPETRVDKGKALCLVLHCSDISHPGKRWRLHHPWTMRLMEEFFRQGDMESLLGLPYSPLCDRNNTHVADAQISFIDFIVEPSFLVLGDMLEKLVPSNTKHIAEEQSGSSSSKKTWPWHLEMAKNRQLWSEEAAKVGKEGEGTGGITLVAIFGGVFILQGDILVAGIKVSHVGGIPLLLLPLALRSLLTRKQQGREGEERSEQDETPWRLSPSFAASVHHSPGDSI